MKKPLPFSLFKRADRPCYLVAFKNEKTGTYLPPVSTRQGIPKKDKVINLKQCALRDMVKEADFTDAEFVVNELKFRTLLNLAVSNPHGQSMDSYVFWAEKRADKPIEASLFNDGLNSCHSRQDIKRWSCLTTIPVTR
ncbi:hypothetical protein FACS1894161_5570 [Spirochaetia bacterium]|nr:hypothetical protein FACS1894161_5570 [Spirochaetia bacterium]